MLAMLISMSMLSMNAAHRIKASLFPDVCPLCSNNIQDNQGCCSTCLQSIQTIPVHTCITCGVPISVSLAPGPCGRCLKRTPPQQQTEHLYIYNSVVRDAILAWKLEGNDVGLQWLIHAAEQRILDLFSPHDILLPVPMPLYRMRRSGIHHSADLCQKIVDIVDCDINWKILRRKHDDTRQSSLHGKARQSNLKGAFILAKGAIENLQPYNSQGKIWVIDDILTTGATLRHACQTARQLKRPVFAFSFARTWHG